METFEQYFKMVQESVSKDKKWKYFFVQCEIFSLKMDVFDLKCIN